jgi:8-oxo-dGTP diphosphatase
VWRRRDGHADDLEILLVHRAKYDDWSLPKGKCDEEEDDAACALREVEEESGLRCRLGNELPSTAYIDPRGRPKNVRYWAMTVESGRFSPNREIDDVRWVPLGEVSPLLSYERDRDVVDALVARI